jgi:nitrogen fixation NifU-like protein
MSDLRDLYQEVILDHHRRPRNFRKLEDANRRADGFNPLCGDKIHIYLRVEDGIVRDVGFEGSGCAISTASASMMTESLKGKSQAEVEALFGQFHDLVTGKSAPDPASLGKLAVFAGVREYPVRVKCATLAWHTLRAALKGSLETVATE